MTDSPPYPRSTNCHSYRIGRSARRPSRIRHGQFRARNCPFRRTRKCSWWRCRRLGRPSRMSRVVQNSTCPLESPQRQAPHPGPIGSDLQERHGFIWKSGTSCCASAGLVSSTSTATIKSRFIEPPKVAICDSISEPEPTGNEPCDVRRSDRGAHIVSGAFRNLTQSTPRKATEYPEGSCM